MTAQQRKNWSDSAWDHIKKNFIPLLGIIGSVIWGVRTLDADFISFKIDQRNGIEFRKTTTTHLDRIDAHLNNLDTVKFQIRDLRNEMNYRFQIEELRRGHFVTERKDAKGNIILMAVK